MKKPMRKHLQSGEPTRSSTTTATPFPLPPRWITHPPEQPRPIDLNTWQLESPSSFSRGAENEALRVIQFENTEIGIFRSGPCVAAPGPRGFVVGPKSSRSLSGNGRLT
jgi:hypothetical protein